MQRSVTPVGAGQSSVRGGLEMMQKGHFAVAYAGIVQVIGSGPGLVHVKFHGKWQLILDVVRA